MIDRPRVKHASTGNVEDDVRGSGGSDGGASSRDISDVARERPARRSGGRRKRRDDPRGRRSCEIGREKIELNWGQIDSSRESLHSIWRLPNRVRLTPFKTFTMASTGLLEVLKSARALVN